MKFLQNMRVASRLAIGFGVLAVAMIAVGTFGLARLSRLNRELDHVVNVRMRLFSDITGMLQVSHHNARYRSQMFLETDPTAIAELRAAQKANQQKNNEFQKQIESLVENDKDRELFAGVQKTRPLFVTGRDRLFQLFEAGKRDEAKQAMADLTPFETAYNGAEEAFQHWQEEQIAQAATEGAALNDATRRGIIGLIALALLLAVAVGVVITQSITRPLLDAVHNAGKIALGRFHMQSKDELGQVSEAFAFVHTVLNETVELRDRVQKENTELQANIMDLLTVVADASEGNLTVRAKVTVGALGNVADAFNSLLEALQSLMGRVARQIEQTNRTVNQITASSTKMADGATSQATEVKAAKILVEKTTEDIKRVGLAADSAADAARNTENSATEGATAIQNIISGMEQLRQNVQAGAKKMKNLGDRSMEITGIVDTIGRISEQTNMLALNAAIEAARAGEHGRGFSVVAEEVRKLAERTATATQEIAKLVTAIHQETTETVAAIEKQTQVVEHESALVSRAGKALIKIREVSSQSASLVNGISTLTKAQIEGSHVVGKAITQISLIAQATLQGVEGTVTTLGQLNKLSTELTQSMSRFKVN
jgi:methyl-accepting chemotaxis protein